MDLALSTLISPAAFVPAVLAAADIFLNFTNIEVTTPTSAATSLRQALLADASLKSAQSWHPHAVLP
jgi:hypothetical protein